MDLSMYTITNRPITGRVHADDGKLYAVINLYADGERKPKWHGTGCLERNGKRKAKQILDDLLNEYNEEAQRIRCQREKQQRQMSNLLDGNSDILLVDYLRAWLPTKLIGSKPIKMNTYNGYEGTIEGHIQRYFGDFRELTLAELVPEDIEEYYSYLLSKGLNSCTLRHHHNILNQAIKHAAKKRVIRYNVMSSVETPENSTFEATVLSSDEVIALLKYFADNKDPLYIPVLLATYYGLRRSEVLGLRWSAIDFNKKTISIERKVTTEKRNGEKVLNDSQTMKTKRSKRRLPLIPFVERQLLRHREWQERNIKSQGGPKYNSNYEGHVCTSPLLHLYKPDYITSHFSTMMKKAPVPKIRFHDLRHTCATLLAENKIPVLDIALFLGHSTVTTTEHYLEKIVAKHDGAASVISSVLSADSPTGCTVDVLDDDSIVSAFETLDMTNQMELIKTLVNSVTLRSA